MTEKRFIVADRWIKDNCIGAWLNIDFNTITDANLCCDLLNQIEKEKRDNGKLASKLLEENEQLKQQLTDCKEKKQQMKEFFMNSEAIIEQKKLQKLIYQRVFNLIDEKIDEFKNGDYGDLPCNTIHMFLDLKEEIGGLE